MSDRYDRGSELGRTMWGTRARGSDRESKVAVEILKLDGRYVDADNIQETVARARRLRHDQLVPIIDVDWEHNYIVSDSREATLRERINAAPISQNEARKFLIRMLGLIKYFQSTSPEFVHGDICPENILFSSPDDSISDAKLLYSLGPTLNGTTLLTGRLKYYAPEMFNSEIGSITSRVDVYSLGFVTLEALAGKDFDEAFLSYGTNERMRWSQFHGSPKDYLQDLDEYVPNLAPDLKNALDGMLVKSFSSRIYDPTQTIEELKVGLESAQKAAKEDLEDDEAPETYDVFGDGAREDDEESRKKESTLSAENVQNKVKTLLLRPYVLMPTISLLVCAILTIVANLEVLQSKIVPLVWGKPTGEFCWAPNPTDLHNAIYIVRREKIAGETQTTKTPLAHGERGWLAPNGVKQEYEFVSREGSKRWLARFDYANAEARGDSDYSSNASLKITLFEDENDVEGKVVGKYEDLDIVKEEGESQTITRFWPTVDGGSNNNEATFYIDGKEAKRSLDAHGKVKASIDLAPGSYEIAVIFSKKQFHAESSVSIKGEDQSYLFQLDAVETEAAHDENKRREDLVGIVMGFDVKLWRRYDSEGRDAILEMISESYGLSDEMRLEALNDVENKIVDSLDKVLRGLFKEERLAIEKGADDATQKDATQKLLNPWDKFDAFLKEKFENEKEERLEDPRPALWRAVVDAQLETRDFLLKTPRLPADADILRDEEFDKEEFVKNVDVKKSLGEVADAYVDALTKSDDYQEQVPRVIGFYKAETSLDDLKESPIWGAETNRNAFLNECRYLEGNVALGAAELVEAVKDQTRFVEVNIDGDKVLYNPQSDENEYRSTVYSEHRKKLLEIAWSALQTYETTDADELFVKLAAEQRNAVAHSQDLNQPLLENADEVKAIYGASNVNRYFVSVAEYFVARNEYEKARRWLDKTSSELKNDPNLKRREARAQIQIAANRLDRINDSEGEKINDVFDSLYDDAFHKDEEYVKKRKSDPDEIYGFPWDHVAERFGYFEDNQIVFPRELTMTTFTLAKNQGFEESLGEIKSWSQGKKRDEKVPRWFDCPTCPIQGLLFCNPNVERN